LDDVKTAFVFAGGGSLGAVQIGALRELVRAGVRPDFVVGASVGALNACFYASRPDPEGVEALANIWLGLKRRDVFPMTLAAAIRWLRGGDSIFDSRALRRLIELKLPLRNLEDAMLPAHVVATDLVGAPVCMSTGSALEAVLASSAIPIAFPSVQIGMQHLMDGAIAGNTPILTAADLGATRIIVLQTGFACSLASPPRSAVARGIHALTLLISNQMQRDLRLLEGKVDVHVAPHLCPLEVSPFNFEHAADLIERSAQVTRDWLESGGLSHADGPDAFTHHHEGMQGAMATASGMDPVSYFVGPPTLGLAKFAANQEDRVYHFASAANRDAFLLDPHRYEPQYGGQCAFAMAQGKSVPGDPRTYRIVDGRLFFNLNPSIQAEWESRLEDNIRRADEHWSAQRPASQRPSSPTISV
jgi:NTE family protein